LGYDTIFIFNSNKLVSQPHPSPTRAWVAWYTPHWHTEPPESKSSKPVTSLSHTRPWIVSQLIPCMIFFLSISVFIFFNICSVILCICWYILKKSSGILVRVVFWLIFFYIKKSVILCVLWILGICLNLA